MPVFVVVGTGAERSAHNPHEWEKSTTGNALSVLSLGNDGGLTQVAGPYEAGINPMSVAHYAQPHTGAHFVYNVDMAKPAGNVRAWKMDAVSGELTALNVVECGKGLDTPCHVSVALSSEHGGACLLVACYGADSKPGIAVLPIKLETEATPCACM